MQKLSKYPILIIILTTLALLSCKDEKPKPQQPTPKTTTTQTKLPTLIDLGAHKCEACQKMTPILDELAKTYQKSFHVKFIDVWQSQNQKIAEQYKISLIPTQIFFDENDKELWRHEGFLPKKKILAKWQELGYKFKPNQTQK